MAKSKSDQIATNITGMVVVAALAEPFNNYNEGQKVLIKDHLSGDVDVSVRVTNDFNISYRSQLLSAYIYLQCPHEEAFGSLFDDVKNIGRQFAEKAFNFYETDKKDILDNWYSAIDYASRRIAVYSG